LAGSASYRFNPGLLPGIRAGENLDQRACLTPAHQFSAGLFFDVINDQRGKRRGDQSQCAYKEEFIPSDTVDSSGLRIACKKIGSSPQASPQVGFCYVTDYSPQTDFLDTLKYS
jgi:hypothetical protein